MVSLIKPVSLLEPSQILMWEECDWGLQFPNRRAIRLKFTQEYVDFLLPIVVLQVVVQMPLQRCQNFESFPFSFVDFLFVCQTASILNRDQVSHLLIECTIFLKWPEYLMNYL